MGKILRGFSTAGLITLLTVGTSPFIKLGKKVGLIKHNTPLVRTLDDYQGFTGCQSPTSPDDPINNYVSFTQQFKGLFTDTSSLNGTATLNGNGGSASVSITNGSLSITDANQLKAGEYSLKIETNEGIPMEFFKVKVNSSGIFTARSDQKIDKILEKSEATASVYANATWEQYTNVLTSRQQVSNELLLTRSILNQIKQDAEQGYQTLNFNANSNGLMNGFVTTEDLEKMLENSNYKQLLSTTASQDQDLAHLQLDEIAEMMKNKVYLKWMPKADAKLADSSKGKVIDLYTLNTGEALDDVGARLKLNQYMTARIQAGTYNFMDAFIDFNPNGSNRPLKDLTFFLYDKSLWQKNNEGTAFEVINSNHTMDSTTKASVNTVVGNHVQQYTNNFLTGKFEKESAYTGNTKPDPNTAPNGWFVYLDRTDGPFLISAGFITDNGEITYGDMHFKTQPIGINGVSIDTAQNACGVGQQHNTSQIMDGEKPSALAIDMGKVVYRFDPNLKGEKNGNNYKLVINQ